MNEWMNERHSIWRVYTSTILIISFLFSLLLSLFTLQWWTIIVIIVIEALIKSRPFSSLHWETKWVVHKTIVQIKLGQFYSHLPLPLPLPRFASVRCISRSYLINQTNIWRYTQIDIFDCACTIVVSSSEHMSTEENFYLYTHGWRKP